MNIIDDICRNVIYLLIIYTDIQCQKKLFLQNSLSEHIEGMFSGRIMFLKRCTCQISESTKLKKILCMLKVDGVGAIRTNCCHYINNFHVMY